MEEGADREICVTLQGSIERPAEADINGELYDYKLRDFHIVGTQ